MKKWTEAQPPLAVIMEIHGTNDFRQVIEVVEKELGKRYDPDIGEYSINKYTGKYSSHWIVIGERVTERVIIDLKE